MNQTQHELTLSYNKELYHYEIHFIGNMVYVQPYKSCPMTSRLQVKKKKILIKNSVFVKDQRVLKNAQACSPRIKQYS